MTIDDNRQFIELPLAEEDSSLRNWRVCSACHGGGKWSRVPSPRILRRYQRAVRDAQPGDPPPKPPVPHIEHCPDCQGSGLEESEIPTAPDPRYPSVAIIGGGIGGLALAVACRHRGIPFTIFERDEDFDQRSQGYGLTLQQASNALKCLGISSLPGALTSTKHVVHLADGTILGEWGLRKMGRPSVRSAPRRRNMHVARQALRLGLLRALGGHEQVTWNHRLIDYDEGEKHEGEGKVDLNFEVGADHVKVQADIVVAADGIRSAVRKQLIGDALSPLRYLDCIVILGICPVDMLDPSPLVDGKTIFQTSNGNERIYMMPFSATEIMWQLSFPLPEEEAKGLNRSGAEALKKEALCRCASWHAPVTEIIAKTPLSEITGYPAYDRELLQAAWLPASSRVTLLGDAAHPMSPFKGQGANQAFLDALSLARSIYGEGCPEAGSVQKSLREFEAEMMPRSALKVKDSAAAATYLHSDVAICEGDFTRGDAATKLGEMRD